MDEEAKRFRAKLRHVRKLKNELLEALEDPESMAGLLRTGYPVDELFVLLDWLRNPPPAEEIEWLREVHRREMEMAKRSSS